MTKTLGGMHVAVLVSPGVDPDHLSGTLLCLRKAGAHAFVLGELDGPVPVATDEPRESRTLAFDEVDADRFDGVIVPEQEGPHALRRDTGAARFIRAMAEQKKPIGAVGNGAGILADALLVEGRRIASDPVLRDELASAGAILSDDELELDGPFITAAGRAQIEPFCRAVVHALERRVSAGVRADPAPP